LRDSGLEVALVDPGAQPVGFRPIALSYASRLILERLGVWAALPVTAIETILVSQAGHFGRTRLDAADAAVPALGYVTEYAALLGVLRARLQIQPSAGEAKCIVHAEGGGEDMTERRYAQDALVALVAAEPVARHTAFERFTPEGPLALLPLQGRYALIWSMQPARAVALASAPKAAFLSQLADAAGPSAGNPLQMESVSVQPLSLRVRPTRVSGNEVYIGNAAQTLHPVAGQGLNLGLRDAWHLARSLMQGNSVPEALRRFAAQRRIDAAATVRITDFLASGFTGSSALLGVARGAALTALDIVPPARRFFARRMIFGASAVP
jgi:2-octaprenyl-6-methoxyphenol hydroxylase